MYILPSPWFFSKFEAKITLWIYPELCAYPSVRSNVIMAVELFVCWITRQSTYVLDSSHLVQNSPYSKIHMELVEGSHLQC